MTRQRTTNKTRLWVNQMKKLVARMESMRGRLHAVVKEKGLLDSEVITLSQELDQLILEFYHRQRGETPAQQLAARAI